MSHARLEARMDSLFPFLLDRGDGALIEFVQYTTFELRTIGD
jgi:hypothetical protein